MDFDRIVLAYKLAIEAHAIENEVKIAEPFRNDELCQPQYRSCCDKLRGIVRQINELEPEIDEQVFALIHRIIDGDHITLHNVMELATELAKEREDRGNAG